MANWRAPSIQHLSFSSILILQFDAIYHFLQFNWSVFSRRAGKSRETFTYNSHISQSTTMRGTDRCHATYFLRQMEWLSSVEDIPTHSYIYIKLAIYGYSQPWMHKTCVWATTSKPSMEVAVITLQRTREQTQRETRGQPPGIMKEQTLLKTREQPPPRIHKICSKRLKAIIEALKAEIA